MRPSQLAIGLSLLVAVIPARANAQKPAETPAPAGEAAKPFVPPKTVNLVFEREIFEYSAAGRRDPFKPQITETSGPQYTELTLTGLIVMPDPRESIATFKDLNKKDYRLHRGDRIGNATIQDITREHVVFVIEEFGMRRQEVMELKLTRGGA